MTDDLKLFGDWIVQKTTQCLVRFLCALFVVEGVVSTSTPDLGNDIVTDSALNQMAEMMNSSFNSGSPLPLG